MAPTIKAASMFLNATEASSVGTTSLTRGKALSWISITTPPSTPIMGVMSSKWRIRG